MRSTWPMRVAKTGYIVISVLLLVLGAALLIWPEASVRWIGMLLGIGMIVFGIIKLVGYFSRDLFRLAFQYDLAFGVLLIALGVITLVQPNGTMSFLCVVYGIPVLADGLFKVQIALDSRRFGIRRWWLIMLAAAVTVLLGVLLVLRPAEGARTLVWMMGLSLVVDSVLNIIVALTTVKIVRNQMPDMIDAEIVDQDL